MYLFFLLLPLKFSRYLGLSIHVLFVSVALDAMNSRLPYSYLFGWTHNSATRSEKLFYDGSEREGETKVDIGLGSEEHSKQWSPEWMTAPSKSAFFLSLTTHHLTSSGGPPECLSSPVGFFYPWRHGGLDLGCPQPESDSCHPPTSSSCLPSTNQRRATTHLFTSQAE
ncbi:hypothetical protein CPAR01_04830 [Colletotrichum paranaense]|uniref:Uncharacterized protein n=1 Tax=Colletotrichum paranaense TaxID=1914294 RepID=A0ABQ9SXG2_9PEZI|nr:uncharacterized protein CPAR01_04830 [Colletotrichum paranaense]KAK1544197.1 hypothetical protein CPAR01_04830 [Colletotrichum paranaense]